MSVRQVKVHGRKVWEAGLLAGCLLALSAPPEPGS
jgi:hypothetical protein